MCLCQAHYNWRDIFDIEFYDLEPEYFYGKSFVTEFSYKLTGAKILNEMKSELIRKTSLKL